VINRLDFVGLSGSSGELSHRHSWHAPRTQELIARGPVTRAGLVSSVGVSMVGLKTQDVEITDQILQDVKLHDVKMMYGVVL